MSAAEPLPVDPFCNTADPARYVPRAATEAALAELRAALAAPAAAVAFTGPAGIGKSLLVRVLESELASGYTFVCLQATPPQAEQVCESALLALGDVPTSDPAGALVLRAALLARRARPLVLVLDSAEVLPPRAWAELAELPRAALRLVLVASERDGLDEALAAFGPGLARVRLAAPLSRAETEDYMRARLEAADAPPDVRIRLLGMVLDLWRSSRGNPQCLHAAISQIQLELWRANEAEPQLQLLAEPEAAPPAVAEDAPDAEPPSALEDLEIDAALEPVPELEADEIELAPPPMETRLDEPLPEPEPVPPPAGEPEPRRAPGRAPAFALGVLTGAAAATGAFLLFGRISAPPPGPLPEPVPLASAPAAPEPEPPPPPLPPVAAPPAPEPEPLPAVAAEPEPAAARTPPPPEQAATPSGPVRVHVQALPWATIYVDGKLAGETPLGDLPVEPGLREFRADMPDGRKLIKRVHVQPGTRVLFQ
jgi:type II secretory pathway predicted ATPase ExeA